MGIAVPAVLPTPRLPTYERLTQPLAWWNPKRWYFDLVRSALRTFGRGSDGVAIGLAHGFDSGVMLEYVYRNQPSGRSWLGRIVDRVYLNAPGWRGIRARGELMTNTIAGEIDASSAGKRRVTMLDVACGGGRYVLNALAQKKALPVSATLRDYRQENIDSATMLAKELDVSANLERGDAFSDADLTRAEKPNLIVVSGLHEIIPDNATVEHHFAQLARIAARPATLVFTIQPWHPQLEFIARVLTSHTGARWIMRLLPWEQTKAWAEQAGFKIRSLTMESQGIFGVAVADLA